MIDKRFRYDGAKIFDGEELLCCTLSIWVEQLVELLNELHEENQRLKFDKSNLHRAMSREEVRHKQFKDKIFCQIDCKITQLKDCHMVNEAKIIEDLKQELIWND